MTRNDGGTSGKRLHMPVWSRFSLFLLFASRLSPHAGIPLRSRRTRTASGFHDQFSVLKPNRVFRTTSPARAAQYAGSSIESYLCLAKRRKRPAQLTLAGHDATGLDILTGNVHQRTPGGINLVDGYMFKRPRCFTASTKRQIQPGNRQQPVRILLRVDTDKTNVVLRVPQQKLIHPGARSVNGPTSVSPHRKRFRGVMPVMASAGQTNRQSPHSMQRLSSTETPESVKKKPAQDRRPRRRGRKRGENGDGRTHASRPSPGQRSIRPSANTEENEAQHQFTDNQQRASQQHGRSRRFQTARSKAQHTRNGYAPAQQMHVSQLLQHL